MTVTDVGFRRIQKWIKKSWSITRRVKKCLTLHPIDRTSEILATQASNPNGSLSNIQRSNTSTHAAVMLPTHRPTYLTPTNTHPRPHHISYHIIPYYYTYIPNGYRSKQTTFIDVGSWGIRKKILNPDSHTVRKTPRATSQRSNKGNHCLSGRQL